LNDGLLYLPTVNTEMNTYIKIITQNSWVVKPSPVQKSITILFLTLYLTT